MNRKIRQDFKQLISLLIAASVIGILHIASTSLISKDGVSWIDKARRISSTESISGISGISGQKYLFWPDCGSDDDAIVGVSVGTNGISVYEHSISYIPALAVYEANIGTDWNHIAITYTSKRPKIYLNGMLVHTGLASMKTHVFAPHQLGGGSYGYFKGVVRNVRVWDRVLSNAEIAVSVSGDPDKDKLVGGWEFSEGSGTIAYDNSGNHNHAAIRGAKWMAYGSSYALQFDGIDDTVILNYPKFSNDITLSAWVKAEDVIRIDPVPARLSRIPDPGYPFLLFLWHKFLSWFGFGQSNMDWILAGQTLAMLCQILALVPLYLFGKQMVGSKYAFVAVLILIFLPWPSEFACDVLREWPYLLFLFGGLLLILWAFSYQRILFFLPAGLIAGVGYMIRPECGQVVIYGLLGLLLSFMTPEKWLPRKKAILGSVLLVLGFIAVFFPYVQIQGRILPDKLHRLMTPGKAVYPLETNPSQQAGISSWMPIDGIAVLAKGVSENQMYYFFPFMLTGLYFFLSSKKTIPLYKWLILGFIIFNCLMYVLLYQQWGYISRRHTLPLAVMTLLFVPLGLDIVAVLFSKRQAVSGYQIDLSRQKVIFTGLLIVGMIICLPKLSTPLGGDKAGFRKTAEFLKQNTPADAVIAVSDSRIAFYADRNKVVFEAQPTGGRWDYLVIIEKKDKSGGSEQAVPSQIKVHAEPLNNSSRHSQEVVVYQRNRDLQ
jgi:hypothetical protein